MLIEIEGEWVEHTAIVNIEPIDVKHDGMSKTEYHIETKFVIGRSYNTIITKCSSYVKRDKLLIEIVDSTNAEHRKDREAHQPRSLPNMGPR